MIFCLNFVTERKENKAEWDWYEQNIVKYFENELQLKQVFSSKQIHRAIGLINVNAVALQYPKTINSKNGKNYEFYFTYYGLIVSSTYF